MSSHKLILYLYENFPFPAINQLDYLKPEFPNGQLIRLPKRCIYRMLLNYRWFFFYFIFEYIETFRRQNIEKKSFRFKGKTNQINHHFLFRILLI